ncbi:hypothetical protein [Mycobacteroides abscessus]|uniref:hypothetical protein n=1 Tax=Mycobacteroides abscessus TaxID=36809 RepID=UPI0016026BF0|nr:hypothetical protein [Mycobacteroides abscessus]
MSASVPTHLIGTTGDPSRRDLSDYLIHLTESVENLTAILSEGFIRPSRPCSWQRSIAERAPIPELACLTEIPLEFIDRLTRRHGLYGVAFTRPYVAEAGGTRVWYLDKTNPLCAKYSNEILSLIDDRDFQDSLWQLAPFIDPTGTGYCFDWEREWRVPRGLRFALQDIAFVLTPDDDGHQQITEEVEFHGAFLIPGDIGVSWDSTLESLSRAVEAKVIEFRRAYATPIEYLPWEDGEYVWIVNKLSTDDAMAEFFDSLEPSIFDAVYDHRDGESTEWLPMSDLDSLRDYADANTFLRDTFDGDTHG